MKNRNTYLESSSFSAVKEQLTGWLRSLIGAADPGIFYFTVGGMVMPLKTDIR